MENARIVKERKLPSAATIAEWGWAEAEKGRPLAVHSPRWRFVAFATRFLPRTTLARLAGQSNEKV